MIRSPATLTIANFNRQTLADLLRPVLDRAMTQGMVGTNVVLEIVAEALSKIGDSEIRTFLDPKTGKLRGGLEIRIEETLSMSKKWRDWDAKYGNEDWMLRKVGDKENEFLKPYSDFVAIDTKLHGLDQKEVKTLVEKSARSLDAMCDVKPTDNRPGLGNTYGK